ncbi:MAG: DUF1552 domain-containing protein [Myxococcales bacterium]
MGSRREFLFSLGAALAASQLRGFPSVRAESTGAPLRLVLWPSMNGAQPEYFWPNAGNLSALSVVTEPLKAYQQQISFVKGLDIAGSENHMAIRSIFTGAPIADYSSPDPGVKSLDQLVRDHLQSSAPSSVASLHLGARPADSIEFYKLYGRSTLFFSPGAVDYEANPVKAFDRVFGKLTTTPTTAPQSKGPSDSDLRNAVLGLHAAELKSLADRLGKSPLEKARVDTHAAALQKLVRDGSSAAPLMPVSCDASKLPSVEKLRASLATNDAAAYQDALFSDIFDAQIDIMARALACGLTRVATLQAGSADGNVIVPIDTGYPHHNTSHGDQATFARCQAWYAGKLARLLKSLDVPDPLDPSGKTVLYNTCIVWLSECLPQSHGSAGVPCMLIGNAGGRLKSGQMVDVQGATNKHLLKTLARIFGVADTDSAHFGSDTLSELVT